MKGELLRVRPKSQAAAEAHGGSLRVEEFPHVSSHLAGTEFHL